ncbi:MAG: ABC transporter substrate-binding protein [Anaerolineae bacterium]|nr:ABC transporter substrate-binding protein [Anaerolineae bacterium]
MKKLFVVLVLGAALAACNPTAAPTPTSPPKDDVSIQFSWVHTIEFAGFYLALEDGNYAEANLNTTLLGGGFDENGAFIDPVQKVVDGQADFGILSGDRLLIERAAGKPLVAIASIYQRSPVAFISLAENNIIRPQDLIGKTVSVDLASSTGIAYLALLAAQGIDPADVNFIPRTDFTNEPLLSGAVDVIDVFINDQPVHLELQGHQLNKILITDYGLDFYANVIFTTEEMIATRPDVVERFLRATLNGMEAYVQNPERGAQLSVSYNAALELASETESAQRSVPLLNPPNSSLGMMKPELWEFTRQILLEQNLLTGEVDLESAYTLSFLNRIYGAS